MDLVSPFASQRRAIETIAKIAERAGCKIGVEDRSQNGISQFLLVNEHRCSTHLLLTSYRPNPRSKREFTSTVLSRNVLEKADAVIFHLAIPKFRFLHTFVVPSWLLLDTYFTEAWQTERLVNLPTRELPTYKNRTPTLNYWMFEDGWHLLPKLERKKQA